MTTKSYLLPSCGIETQLAMKDVKLWLWQAYKSGGVALRWGGGGGGAGLVNPASLCL